VLVPTSTYDPADDRTKDSSDRWIKDVLDLLEWAIAIALRGTHSRHRDQVANPGTDHEPRNATEPRAFVARARIEHGAQLEQLDCAFIDLAQA
jgi:hypothetical protein